MECVALFVHISVNFNEICNWRWLLLICGCKALYPRPVYETNDSRFRAIISKFQKPFEKVNYSIIRIFDYSWFHLVFIAAQLAAINNNNNNSTMSWHMKHDGRTHTHTDRKKGFVESEWRICDSKWLNRSQKRLPRKVFVFLSLFCSIAHSVSVCGRQYSRSIQVENIRCFSFIFTLIWPRHLFV